MTDEELLEKLNEVLSKLPDRILLNGEINLDFDNDGEGEVSPNL